MLEGGLCDIRKLHQTVVGYVMIDSTNIQRLQLAEIAVHQRLHQSIVKVIPTLINNVYT